MDIVLKKLSDIRPYEKNPRKNDEAVKYVAESISQFGFKVPIVIDKDGIIVAGHTRYKAAKKLNLKEVPCIVADDLTEEQVKAFRLADNKVAEKAEWDFELLADELDDLFDFDMTVFGFEEETKEETTEVVEDDFEAEIPEEPKAKLGDIYQLGRHRLMCGDSTDKATVEKLMNGNKADMVFTDPPYGMNLDASFGEMANNPKAQYRVKKNYSNVIGDNEDFKPELITTIFDNFGYCREIFVWGADYFAELLPNKNNGSWLVWDKRATIEVNWTTSEFELCWSKNRHHRKILRHTWHGLIGLSSEDTKKRVHPTQKPITMINECLENYSDNNDTIVDLYGGSGSTLIACEQLGRACYMMELDPKYIDVIIKRWETLTGEKAVLLNG